MIPLCMYCLLLLMRINVCYCLLLLIIIIIGQDPSTNPAAVVTEQYEQLQALRCAELEGFRHVQTSPASDSLGLLWATVGIPHPNKASHILRTEGQTAMQDHPPNRR